MTKTLTGRIESVEEAMEEMKKKMDGYELEQKTNNAILLSVQAQVNSLVTIGKWLLGLLTTVGAGIIIALIVGHLNK